MNESTTEALKNVIKGARFYLNRKYGDRKRLSQPELWENATMIRDIKEVEDWLETTEFNTSVTV